MTKPKTKKSSDTESREKLTLEAELQKLSFEELMERLEGLVARLEDEKVSLDDAISLNEEAVLLIQVCRERLSKAEQKITRLVQSSDGSWEEQPLD